MLSKGAFSWGREVLGGLLVLAAFLVLLKAPSLMGDVLALTLFVVSAFILYLRIGPLGGLTAASALTGSVVYYLLARALGTSDALSYYRVGHEYLSTGIPPIAFGTDFMYFLSYQIQHWLPVSVFGLAWFTLALKLLALPSLKNTSVQAPLFFLLMATAPNVVIWTGLFSKDLLSTIAVLLSITAYFAYRDGRVIRWLVLVIFALALEAGARPYMIPMVLVPHLAVMVMHLYRVLWKSRFQRVPPGTVLMIPLVLIGIVAAYPIVTQYIGIEDTSQINERIEKLSGNLNIGGTAVLLQPIEKVFLLAAPAPYRVRNPLLLLVSIVSLMYILWLCQMLFKLHRQERWSRLEAELVVFCVAPLALWTFAYWGVSNMGALERVKGQILPFLFLLMAHLAWAVQTRTPHSSGKSAVSLHL